MTALPNYRRSPMEHERDEPEPFPACDLCGQRPHVDYHPNGFRTITDDRCGVEFTATDEAHARSLWRGMSQE